MHPYIPNATPAVQREMLAELGLADVNDLYASIPEHLRFRGPLELPGPLSESALRRRIRALLGRNTSCSDAVSFLGGGCWPHDVPAVCDEVNQRAEFVTAYLAQPYSDHGKCQALFEYQSLLGELVGMEVVGMPTYDWAAAAATSIRMAARITGRNLALVARSAGPQRRRVIEGYCAPDIRVSTIPYAPEIGGLDLDAYRELLAGEPAAVYVENPSYLGTLEEAGAEIARLAHDAGALAIVGVDPISLGVIAAPGDYGADIVCGDLQPLGMHMAYGGTSAGFIASADEESLVSEYPGHMIGLTTTTVPGERGFGYVAHERTMYVSREHGREFTGSGTALWGITAAVYLALVGPAGLARLGRTVMENAHYACSLLGGVSGVVAPALAGPFFKEFVFRLEEGGVTAAALHRQLLERGFFAGIDVGDDYPELAGGTLCCVTEVHTRDQIDAFAAAVDDVLRRPG